MKPIANGGPQRTAVRVMGVTRQVSGIRDECLNLCSCK